MLDEEDINEHRKLVDYLEEIKPNLDKSIKELEATRPPGFNSELWLGRGIETGLKSAPHFRVYVNLRNPIYVETEYWDGYGLVTAMEEVASQYFLSLFYSSVLWLNGRVDKPEEGWERKGDRDFFSLYPNISRMRTSGGPLFDQERDERIAAAERKRVFKEQLAEEKSQKEARIQEALKRREERFRRPGWPWR